VKTRTAHAAFFVLAVAALVAPAPSKAEKTARPKSGNVVLQLEGFGAVLNDGVGGSNLAVSAGYGGRAGFRHGAFGVFGEITCDRWLATEVDSGFVSGVLDFGVGAEALLADGRIRASIAGGGSTLLFDSAFHGAGETGLFFDFRPLAVRFPLWPGLVLELSPIGLAVVSPALGEPHIRRIEYRSTLSLEVSL
jgi:hypothetical protein